MYGFLGGAAAARTLPPVTIRELRLALQDRWAAVPQELIVTLILSMGRRCETCLARRVAGWQHCLLPVVYRMVCICNEPAQLVSNRRRSGYKLPQLSLAVLASGILDAFVVQFDFWAVPRNARTTS
ncbi:hypothetical protein TNCV_1271371 [Trichonephila clavipes]|nr:hypothetical protein TNCV_1271371 [Trichonephila clavipes]